MNTKTDVSDVAQSQEYNLWGHGHSYQPRDIDLAVLNAVSKCVCVIFQGCMCSVVFACVCLLSIYFYISPFKVFKIIYWFL